MRFASPRLLVNETTSGAVVGGLRRNYGTTESRIDGIMELWIGRVGSRLIAQSHSLLSLPSIPFRLLSLVFQLRSVSEAITSGLKRRIAATLQAQRPTHP